MKKRSNLYKIAGIIAVVVIFIAAAQGANRYEFELQNLISLRGVSGMSAYTLITVAAIVFAPVSTLPLLPVAVALWGSFLAALLSIAGWTIGASITFILARCFGRKILGIFVSFEKINKYSDIIPSRHLFWSVVFLRLVFPVDVLSYAVGLFTTMRFWPYFWATLLGVSPFAFIFSYAVNLPVWYQITIGVIVVLMLAFGYRKIKVRI